jgi:hypothetical protein
MDISGFIQHGLQGRSLTNTLLGVVNALGGEGLPLYPAKKNTDPATLFRVRGDSVLLLWRYPF